MPTNLAGAAAAENFSTPGASADSNAPYTNTGGANAGAVLTLTTTAAGVVVDEPDDAFSGAGNPIVVDLAGPGEFVFQGANGYTGGTTLQGGELAFGAVGALGTGALTFAGDDEILLATVTATLANSITIDSALSTTIAAAAGDALTLAPAGDFSSITADDALLRFGSAAETGTVVLAPTNAVSVQGDRAIFVDGGVLRLGDANAATLLDSPDSPLTVGLTSAAATLDIDGELATLFNLSGAASGLVTDGGGAATITADNTANSTFAGVIADGAGAITLVVGGVGGTTLTLTGADTYSGGTTIDAAQTLAIGDGGTTGSIVGAVVDGGALAFDHDDDLAFAGAISGAGSLIQDGTGVLTLSGDNTFSGGATIDSGELSLATLAALGAGNVTFANSGTALEARSGGTLENTLVIAAGVSATLGATSGNTLAIACPNGFTENGGSGTTLQLGSSADTGTVELAMSGVVAAQADFGVSVDGGEALIGDVAAARFLEQAFDLTVGSSATPATLDMGGMAASAVNLNGTSAGVVTDTGAAATLTLSNSIDSSYAGIIKDGAGVVSVAVQAFGGGALALTGANAYSGGTTIDSGEIAIGNLQALGSGALTFAGNGAGLQSTVTGALTNNPITIEAGVSASFAAAPGVALTVAPASFTDGGGAATTLHFGGAGETGTVRLAPATTASASALGAVAVDGGALALGDALAATMIGALSGGLTVGSGATSATLDLAGQSTTVFSLSGDAQGMVTDNGAAAALTADSPGDASFGGVVADGTGALSLTTEGVGTLALLGADTYSGGTTITAGRLVLGQNTSAGGGEIAFAAQAFGALAIDDGADPTNAIALPDATDLIDFLGLGFADGDRLTPLSAGRYALETAGGGVLEDLSLTGALNDSTLIVGGDGASGAEIAAPYTAAQAAGSAALAASAARVLIVDTAADIAANAAAITSLIAAGRVASVFTSGATLSDAAPLNLGVIGGANSLALANASGDFISLYGTAGAFDAVTGSAGTVDLSGAQATISGGGDLVAFVGGTGDIAALAGTGGDWDYVEGSNGTINLESAQASVFGGGDKVHYASGSGDRASLYQTGANWDAVAATNAVVYLTSARSSVSGGGDTIDFAGGSGNIASLYETGNDWDSVLGSNAKLYLTNSRASVFGGDDTIELIDGTDDRLSLYDTDGAWDFASGVGSTIYLGDAKASVVGGGDTIRAIGATGNAASLYDTGGDWDAIVAAAAKIYFTSAQASVFGSADTLDFDAGTGNAASLYDTAGTADAITGSLGTVYLTSAQATIAGGGDTIDFAAGSGNSVTLSGTTSAADVVNGSGGAIALAGARATVNGSNDTFAITDDSTLTLNGSAETIAFAKGIGGEDVIGGFAATDLIQLSHLDFANFAAVSAHLSQTGAGAVITLDAKDTITLTGVAASSLTAAEFAFA